MPKSTSQPLTRREREIVEVLFELAVSLVPMLRILRRLRQHRRTAQTWREESAVTDRTGLAAPFDVELIFGPGPGRLPLAQALREHAGLELARVVVPGDVLVIEHVEMPVSD
jgi:uncharacterized protein (TIGR03435 family)